MSKSMRILILLGGKRPWGARQLRRVNTPSWLSINFITDWHGFLAQPTILHNLLIKPLHSTNNAHFSLYFLNLQTSLPSGSICISKVFPLNPLLYPFPLVMLRFITVYMPFYYLSLNPNPACANNYPAELVSAFYQCNSMFWFINNLL